jgi:hypothetical protein
MIRQAARASSSNSKLLFWFDSAVDQRKSRDREQSSEEARGCCKDDPLLYG